MTIYHLIILLVRFFAICLAIFSINRLVYAFLDFQALGSFSVVNLIILSLLMLGCLLVWFMPVSVARIMTGYRGESGDGSERISADQFSAVTFLTLVLYLGCRVLSDGFFWLYYLLNYEKYGLVEMSIDANASMYSTLVEAIFLIAILIGRRGIFLLFKKLRTFS